MTPTNEDLEKQLSFVEHEMRIACERFIGEQITHQTMLQVTSAVNAIMDQFDYYRKGKFLFSEWIELECVIHPEDQNQIQFKFHRKK